MRTKLLSSHLISFSSVALTAIAMLAQGNRASAQTWEGPWQFFQAPDPPPASQAYSEIAHAALIGKPGGNQGKVVCWRAVDEGGVETYLWDPAAPGAIQTAVKSDVAPHGVFCSGHAWNRNGYGWSVGNRIFNQNNSNIPASFRYASGVLWPFTVGDPIGSDRVVVIGGADQVRPKRPSSVPGQTEQMVPGENRLYVIQSPTALVSPSWTSPSAMLRDRVYQNAVLLPDVSMLVTGGCRDDFEPPDANHEADPVSTEEIFQFDTQTWTSATPSSFLSPPRLYHSVSLLLPDARVLSMGGFRGTTNLPQLNHADAHVFSPPYLNVGLVRPAIGSAPSELKYGDDGIAPRTIAVEIDGISDPASAVSFVTLMRCGSVTHHFDFDQRCVRLNVDVVMDSKTFTIDPLPAEPEGSRIAPPGYYMLFVVRTTTTGVRVPSVASFVKVRA